MRRGRGEGWAHLEDDEEGVAHAELVEVAVHTRDHVRHGLTDGDEHAEEFFCAVPAGRAPGEQWHRRVATGQLAAALQGARRDQGAHMRSTSLLTLVSMSNNLLPTSS